MTLTQRLTRAGATFIIFGVAAAVLPQQNGAARAVTDSGTCNKQPFYYRLTEGGSSTNTTSSTVASGKTVTIDAFTSADNSTFSPANASYTFNGGSLSTSSGISTTVTGGSVPGNYTLTGTFTDTTTHTVDYPITVTQ